MNASRDWLFEASRAVRALCACTSASTCTCADVDADADADASTCTCATAVAITRASAVTLTSRAAQSADAESGRRARLIDWLLANGARLDGLVIAQCGDERGVRARVDLADGSELARIPPHFFITAEAARRSPLGQRLSAAGHAVSDMAYLAVHLLELRREGSFWAPYIDSLPTTFPGHPIGYGPLELAALDSRSGVGGLVKTVIKMYRSDFQSVAEGLLAEGFDLADFTWAYTCVRTRCFDITLDGKPALALIPLADLLNHASEPASNGKRPTPGDYVVTATRDIAAGEEVTASYGRFSNLTLLSIYGFFLADNPLDNACLLIAGDGVLLTRRYADAGMRDLFIKLRRQTPARLCDRQSTDGRTPGGIDHESACLDQLHEACEATLVRRVGCLADDESLRGDGPVPASATPLLKAIESEQQVLWHWASLCVIANRVLRERGTDTSDRALLKYIDPDYAAELQELIERQGETT